jgi:hypothetical protein
MDVYLPTRCLISVASHMAHMVYRISRLARTSSKFVPRLTTIIKRRYNLNVSNTAAQDGLCVDGTIVLVGQGKGITSRLTHLMRAGCAYHQDGASILGSLFPVHRRRAESRSSPALGPKGPLLPTSHVRYNDLRAVPPSTTSFQ